MSDFNARTSTAGTGVPMATGTEPFIVGLAMGGTDQASAVPLAIELALLGTAKSYFKGSGILTLAETRAGLIASSSSAQVVWDLPTFSQLGYTRTPGTTRELVYLFQRQGAGQLFVNPSQYKGTVASDAAMTGLVAVKVGDYCIRSDQSSTVYQCTALPSSTSGNWTTRTGSNAPTATGITVHWNDKQLDPLAAFHEPVMLMTCGQGNDEWFAF